MKKIFLLLISLTILITGLTVAQEETVELKELGKAPYYLKGKIVDSEVARKFLLDRLYMVEYVLYQLFYEDTLYSLSKEELKSVLIEEIEFEPGYRLDWMMWGAKTKYKGIREVRTLKNVIWAGEKPFKAFLFRLSGYSFIVPQDCGNISLWRTKYVG